MSKPKIPDPNVAAQAGVVADAENYPFQYAIDAVAKTGGKYTDPSTGQVYDFTGLGDADNSAIVSDQMAQTLLDIQKGYGADYVKQRLADLQQSDPTGYAARKQLFDKIMTDADANPDRPLAQDTQDLITQELEKGGKLDAKETQQVQEGVRGGQVKRGIILGNAPASAETSAIVNTGDQLKASRQAEGAAFLQAGVSPEDVTYRRIQQSLSNLGAFVNNETPEAQFGQLSGAQSGAAPFTSTGTPAATVNPNAASQGISNAFQIYQNQLSQGNPWLMAASTGVNTFSAATNLGYNPWSGTGVSAAQTSNLMNEFNGVGAAGTTGSNSAVNPEWSP